MFVSRSEKTAANLNVFIDVCMRDADLAATERVMADVINAGLADVCSFNVLANVRLQSGDVEEARRTVEEMRSVGVSPNCATLNELLDVVAKNSAAEAWRSTLCLLYLRTLYSLYMTRLRHAPSRRYRFLL